MGTAFVSFGGNVGDVAATFDVAAEMLNEECGEVVRLSSLYSTAAVGDEAGDPFLNAVAEVEMWLTPDEALARLLQIEHQLGRERTVRWGPRTIDLDLVLYEDIVLDSEVLTLPHPRCWYRKFVLDGLAEIAGARIHPVKQVSISDLRRRISSRPFEVGVVDGDSAAGQSLVDAIHSTFFDADAMPWQPGDEEPALIVWHADASIPFDALPRVPRLDLTAEAGSPVEAMRDVLLSAGLMADGD